MSRQCPEPCAVSRAEMIRSAEQTSREMLATVEERNESDRIAMDVRAFRGIARLLGLIAAESARCGGDDCMGRAIDGVRLWVTKDRFDQMAARASQAEREARGLARMLELASAGADDAFPSWSAIDEPGPQRPVSFS